MRPSNGETYAIRTNEFSDRPSWRYETDVALTAMNLPENSAVLDFGCNTGDSLRVMPPQVNKWYGMDVNPDAVLMGKEANAGLKGVTFATRLPVGSSKFDGILCSHTLNCVPDPLTTLLQLKSYLKPNGKMAITIPNMYSYHAHWLHNKLTGYESDPLAIHGWTAKQLSTLCVKCGLKVIDIKYTGYMPPMLSWLDVDWLKARVILIVERR